MSKCQAYSWAYNEKICANDGLSKPNCKLCSDKLGHKIDNLYIEQVVPPLIIFPHNASCLGCTYNMKDGHTCKQPQTESITQQAFLDSNYKVPIRRCTSADQGILQIDVNNILETTHVPNDYYDPAASFRFNWPDKSSTDYPFNTYSNTDGCDIYTDPKD